MKKIKVGIVNYLNTAPLIYGLNNSAVKDRIELVPDYPANLARDLAEGIIDLGLVPVAVIPELKESWLVGDYCIGCDGAVASVCIFSDVPIEKIEKLLLDYQSRTSVELAKLLIRNYWKINPLLIEAGEDFENEIEGPTAGLVIGDRSFVQKKVSKYAYDLGEAWKSYTGLPFVFAAWISNQRLPEDFIQLFNEANAYGVNHVQDVITALKPDDSIDLDEYFTKYISYKLNADKKRALEIFLDHLRKNIT